MSFLFWILLVIFVTFEAENKPTTFQLPKLIVVSYDAFRYDYFDRNITPYLVELKNQGTSADYMKNAFVTKTFPNHHSISTGYYIENHGVIDNEFYNENLNKTFKYSPELYHYNNDILPIWTLNDRAGKGRHSGLMMWPGSEFDYHGISTVLRKPWNITVPWKDRVDELISWFKHPSTPINFGMLYIEEPDYHGHGIGINSHPFNEILKKLDTITQYLHEQLKQNCLNDVNVVHLSDHGMSTVTLNNIINLTNYINPNEYISSGLSPVMHIYPYAGKENAIYNKLKKASTNTNKFEVYLKQDIPQKYHYSQNDRIGPILVIAKVGYAFQDFNNSVQWYEQTFNFKANEKSEFGIHGYDNEDPKMRPFFFGIGPSFLPNCKVLPFENIDLLPLFCEILEIQCPQVNGTVRSLRTCLDKYHNEAILYKGIYIGGVVISILGIIALFFVYLRRKRTLKNVANYRVSNNQTAD